MNNKMSKNNKIRTKEKGLVDIVRSGRHRKSDISLKPRYRLFSFKETETGKQMAMPYPVIKQDNYGEYLVEYLNSLYKHISKIAGRKGFSFEINPEQIERYKELSEKMDYYIPGSENDNAVSMNELSYISERRKKFLNEYLNKGQIHDIIGMISTKNNTEKGNGKISIKAPTYRPICNNSGYMGMVMGLDKTSNSMTWEAYNLTNEFIDYLKKVHKIIIGSEYDSLQGNVPLQIDPSGIGLAEDEIQKKEQQIKDLSETYKEKSIESKFVHTKFKNRNNQLYINHIDGSLMNYDFEKLRQRLFTWRDKKGTVKKENYKKVFKINMSPNLKHKGFELPIYSSLDKPEKFDMHDVVEAYMGRYVV